MADQADVETALVTLVAQALYPNGTDQESLPGPDCRIYRGWPNAAALDSDLSAGRINVTIFPVGDPTRITTRYIEPWVGAAPNLELVAAVQGNTVTFSGSAAPGQVAGILADRRSYAYRIQAGDSPSMVAANLAMQARVDWVTTVSGSQLTLHGAAHLIARVAADTAMKKEIRRQEQGFRVTCWCPTPASRDTAAAAIDLALSDLTFLDLPDSSARVNYAGTAVFDQSQDALLYRRDLIYRIEYATMLNEMQPSMLFGDLMLNAAQFGA